MWRSKARVSLLRSLIRSSSSPQSQFSLKALPLDPPSVPIPPPKWLLSSLHHRLFSSVNDVLSAEDDDGKSNGGRNIVDSFGDVEISAAEVERRNLGPSDGVPIGFGDGEEGSVGFKDGSDALRDSGEESLGSSCGDEFSDESVDGVFSCWDEVGEDGLKAVEIDAEKVAKMKSVLRESSVEQLESSLDSLELSLSEDLVAMIFEDSGVSSENLMGFIRWAWKTDESVKTSTVLGLLVDLISSRDELNKMEAYKLWDMVKEVGGYNGLVKVEILNKLISMFSKLRKAKAGLEVFNDFDRFGCSPNGETYYLTIEALSKISWSHTAWTVCEKMLDSGNLPDGVKIGWIITFFCRNKKAKEAHLVYLMARDKKINITRADLDFLIGGLSSKDENVHLAVQLLEDYPAEFLRSANRSFGKVIKALCKLKDLQGAKKLLMRMADSGPPPGNAVFNYVITGLCKGGDLDDAKSLTKLMETRGLIPDIYTYIVIMSGYAKGGLMDEAYEIFSEAKKKHQKLKPAIYHVLIRGYCKMENFDEALKCLKDMQEDDLQPNADEYNKIIQSLCLKALDWNTAEKLLEEMTERGLYLNSMTRSLIAAVKELEEETLSGELQLEA